MYCHHCANYIDEHAIEAKRNSLTISENVTDKTKIQYVCPRCGHLIKSDLNEKEIKELAQASHAMLQRSRNSFASGMGFNVIGIICFGIAAIFFLLARKPSNQYKITLCNELYISIALFVTFLALLTIGVIFVINSRKCKKTYSELLKDINNNTFVQ